MPESKLSLSEWKARIGPLPDLLSTLAFDLYVDGRAPANAVAEAVATLDVIHVTGRTQNGGNIPHRTRRACHDAVQEFRAQEVELAEAKGSLAKASTPEPWSTSKTSNWIAKLGGLPNYIQHVSHGIKRSNPELSESEAIARAIGVVKNWAEGKGNVDAETRAAARKAIAEWEALKAKQHAKSAGSKAKAAVEAHMKLVAAASRLSHIVQPIPDQATFAKRYGNRMGEIESVLLGLRKEKPLAHKMATAMLEAPEGLPVVSLVEELVERKQTTLLLLEALGYGSTPIRAKGDGAKKGTFHGMHGHERAAKKRKLIPGTVEHPAADAIASGGRLTEAGAVAGPFEEQKHARGAGGKFSEMGGQAKPAAAPAAVGSPHNGNAVAAAIQANDPQFRELQQQRATTAGYEAEHPVGAPLSADQLQSLGYSNDAAGIVQFQKDYGVPASGKLDEATLATIANVYGQHAQTAAGAILDTTGIAGAGASVSGAAGARGAAGRKTLGKTSARNINEAVRAALVEAIGDEPLIFATSRSGAPLLVGPPSGWNDTDSGHVGRDGEPDYGFDDEGVPPPNLRPGDGLQMCATCPFFSPGGWVTARKVQGGCMQYSAQVNRDQVCDDWTTLVPGEVHLRVFEARLIEAEAAGDNDEIVATRAALKVIRESDGAKGLVLREAAAAEAFRLMESATGIVEGVDLSAAGRAAMAKKKQALGDGSYPIPNVEFLKKAINAYGRAVAAGKGAKVKAWIIKRAKALGAEGMLPQGWIPAGS